MAVKSSNKEKREQELQKVEDVLEGFDKLNVKFNKNRYPTGWFESEDGRVNIRVDVDETSGVIKEGKEITYYCELVIPLEIQDLKLGTCSSHESFKDAYKGCLENAISELDYIKNIIKEVEL